ncbi:SMI1/KNR4 family protein [Paracoccus sp. (in: a-proteobacteria)]|uniref:SMI1/KNR4 family protein n=1 Tax=Paracoccus sp. TaxID=267 RepID=UPI003A8612E6
MNITWERCETELPSVSDTDLDLVQKRRGVILPEGYRNTVKIHCGETPVPNVVAISWGGVPVGPLFFSKEDFKGTGRSMNVWYWFRALDNYYDENVVQSMVPFSSDTGNGIFAFDYRNGKFPAVVYLDLENAPDDGEASIHPIAESWDGFLAALRD